VGKNGHSLCKAVALHIGSDENRENLQHDI
jgi:hypothetical protein